MEVEHLRKVQRLEDHTSATLLVIMSNKSMDVETQDCSPWDFCARVHIPRSLSSKRAAGACVVSMLET